MDDRDIVDVIERAGFDEPVALEDFLELFDALVGKARRAVLFVDRVVVLDQQRNVFVDGLVEFGPVLGGPRNDQRGPRLVDQDGIHFVDDRVIVSALHHLGARIFHVVAQIVETELVVGAIGDVGIIGCLALGIVEPVDDHPRGQAQKAVEPAHPFTVAARQIVVDGDDMDALVFKRVEIG